MRPNNRHFVVFLHWTISFILQNAAVAQNDTASPALGPTLSPTLTSLAPSLNTIQPTIATRSPALELSPTLLPSVSPTTALGNATFSPTPLISLGNGTLSPSPAPSSLRNLTLSPLPPPTVESSTSPTYSPSYAPTSVSRTLAPSSVDATLSPTRITSAPTIDSTSLSSLPPSFAKTIEPTTISPTYKDATALPTLTSTNDGSTSSTPSPSEENETSTDAPAIALSASPTMTLTSLNPASQRPTLSPTYQATSELPTKHHEVVRLPTPFPTYFREVHGWNSNLGWVAQKNTKSGKGYPAKSRSEKFTTNALVGNGWIEEGVWLTSKSSKETVVSPYDESFQHVMSMDYEAGTTPPPKLTGKASRLVDDPNVLSINVPVLNPNEDNRVDNGIKIASKTGKGDGIIVTVSKSSKSILEQSVDYSYMGKPSKAIKHQTFGAPKLTQDPVPKSAKSLSNQFSLSIEFAADFGRIKPTSKSGNDSQLQSNDVLILSKSGKTLYNTGILRSKSSKSASKSVKLHYQSLFYDAGQGMTKSAKSNVSKSSKVSFNMNVTPEEAGLPFRAKSSKSIPLLNIHTDANSSNLVKQVQVEKYIILDNKAISKSIQTRVHVIVESIVMVALVYASL